MVIPFVALLLNSHREKIPTIFFLVLSIVKGMIFIFVENQRIFPRYYLVYLLPFFIHFLFPFTLYFVSFAFHCFVYI